MPYIYFLKFFICVYVHYIHVLWRNLINKYVLSYVLLILALEHFPVAHPYHPLWLFFMVWDCTTDQLHAPIIYKHKKVMKPELPVS